MSTILQLLSESDAGQMFLESNEEAITEAAQSFHETPQQVKDYVMENLDQFVVPGDLNATYAKIQSFTESTVMQVLHEMSEELSE